MTSSFVASDSLYEFWDYSIELSSSLTGITLPCDACIVFLGTCSIEAVSFDLSHISWILSVFNTASRNEDSWFVIGCDNRIVAIVEQYRHPSNVYFMFNDIEDCTIDNAGLMVSSPSIELAKDLITSDCINWIVINCDDIDDLDDIVSVCDFRGIPCFCGNIEIDGEFRLDFPALENSAIYNRYDKCINAGVSASAYLFDKELSLEESKEVVAKINDLLFGDWI